MLALGRTKRLVSTAQRRALMIRDHGMCQYPGCHQTRHLKAHHLVPWILGGRTDLENLTNPFDLHTCVQALFTIKLPQPAEDQDQQAA